jgi:AraC-like DNA-binding protein
MNRDMLKENRTHGDTMFPFGEYSINCTPGNTVLDCHWHGELEFLLVTEGKATFQIDTSYYEVSAGEAIFINSGEIHAGYPIEGFNCSFSAIVFDAALLHNNNIYDAIQVKYIEPLLNKQYSLPVHIKGENPWEKEVLEHLKAIIKNAISRSYGYELIVKANLYIIISSILCNINRNLAKKNSLTSNYKTERLKKILEYIHDNYNQKISIRDLALMQNMSEGHFCRFFKQMVRKTPVDYINYYRINKAVKLLENNNKKIIEIAIDVGFDNCSYFINTFKHYMNCTPSEYRKQNNE